jgi:F-type H+-transporting ATPase subunit a
MRLATFALLLAVALPLGAQETLPAERPTVGEGIRSAVEQAGPQSTPDAEKVDIIMPHITDSHHLELPCFNSHFACEVELPRWPPVHIGSMTIDLSPTKHVVMLLFAATLCCIVLILAARGQGRHARAGGAPKGVSNGIEAMVLYLRNEVVIPNVGPHGNAFVPFILTLFFFILFANVLGLIPYGSSPRCSRS